MTYVQLLNEHKLEKPDYKTFDVILKDPANVGMVPSFGQNGYVVIPDDMPIDCFNSFYDFLDDSPVGGINFGGYLLILDGELALTGLDNSFFAKNHSEEDKKVLPEIKKYCLRVIGFDNEHIVPNQMNAESGAKYISSQLKRKQKDLEENK